MGLYTGANQWVNGVYQFEESDVVQGGPTGIDNKPLRDLADRTQYLKNQLGIIQNLAGEKIINGGYTITNADAGKMFLAVQTANDVAQISIADASTFKLGTIIPIYAYTVNPAVITLSFTNGNYLYTISGNKTKLHFHNNESCILMAANGEWRLLAHSGNFFEAGYEFKGRREIGNSISLKGQWLSRALYPRLWEFVQTLGFGYEVTDEYTWWSDFYLWKGLFTIGDGYANFRLPDERGLFERMIDAGRGADTMRRHNFPGGFEYDQLSSHSHGYKDRYYRENINVLNDRGAWTRDYMGSQNNGVGQASDTDNDNDYAPYVQTSTDAVGGNETIVKNIGKLHLIKF